VVGAKFSVVCANLGVSGDVHLMQVSVWLQGSFVSCTLLVLCLQRSIRDEPLDDYFINICAE
jgi:hypothetical protein